MKITLVACKRQGDLRVPYDYFLTGHKKVCVTEFIRLVNNTIRNDEEIVVASDVEGILGSMGHIIYRGKHLFNYEDIHWIVDDIEHDTNGVMLRGQYSIKGGLKGFPYNYFSWDDKLLIDTFGKPLTMGTICDILSDK